VTTDPTILAFDAAAAACSAALWQGGAVRARRFAAMERGQAEALMPMIESVMAEGGAAGASAFAGVDALAVTVGPGSFTGLRIALAVARGLRLAIGAPIVGVGTLAAVAAQVRDPAPGERVLALIDSKRGDLYAQLFDPALAALRPPVALAPEALAAYAGPGPLVVVGDALAPAHAHLRGGVDGLRFAAGSGVPDAADVARLAAMLVARNGGRADGAGLPASPLYLRAPDVSIMTDAAPPVAGSAS
jgi:tRNA threonylcarbamoyladenosine biosynthesis protein TsaB